MNFFILVIMATMWNCSPGTPDVSIGQQPSSSAAYATLYFAIKEWTLRRNSLA